MATPGTIWKPAARLPVWARVLRAGVLERARRRQRRRHAAASAVAIAVVATAILVAITRPWPAAPPSRFASVPPRAVLARDPYMGVACHVPNLISCDRVGLSVWLRRPAVAVTATIAGRPIALDDPMWSGPRRDGRRKLFAGFLQPAGIVTRLHVHPQDARFWFGADFPPPARVRLRIAYGAGRGVTTEVGVSLNTGWG